jgi:tetratricopeptide (TPR) repeat protein
MRRNLKMILLAGSILSTLIAGGCSHASADAARTKVAADTSVSSNDPDVDAALKFIEKAPDSPRGFTQLAVLYVKRGRETGDFVFNAKAETAVGKALEIAPSDLIARKLQASLHLTFHRFPEALEGGKHLEKSAPGDSFVYGVLADANIELGNYKEAVTAAQKMVDLKPNSASYARVGHLRSLYGDHRGAVEIFSLAAKIADPLDAEARSWHFVQLGDEYWKNGIFAEAEKAYDEALSSFPGHYLALGAKGKVRASLGGLDSAEKYLTDAQNRVPNPETLILLGDVYARKGDAQKASETYALVEVVEQKLGMKGDQKRLALFWADRGEKLEDALAIATAEYVARKDIFTTDVLAWCLLKNGRAAEAKKIITQAMRLKTGDARILFHAGMIERELGNRKEAARLIAAALKTNPAFDLIQSENARRTLAELNTK